MTSALKEFCEAEETEIIACEYCKEEIDDGNRIAKINYPDKDFCCLGCVEKYEEKQKREKFQAVELPQDTIQRLCKTVRDQQEEIETLKTENDHLIIENTDLKAEKELFQKENKMLETLACNRSDEIVDLKAKLFSAKSDYDTLYSEFFAAGKYITSEAEIDELKREVEKLQKDKEYREIVYNENLSIIRKDTAEAKLEKRELFEKLEKVKEFAAALSKVVKPCSVVYCLSEKINEILNNPVDSGLN